PIFLPGVEVVGAMRRRGVHGAGARIGGDVGGQHAEDTAFEERMLKGGALHPGAFEAGQFAGLAEIAGGDYRGGELSGDDVDGAFVVSHPRARKKARGWGTGSLG